MDLTTESSKELLLLFISTPLITITTTTTTINVGKMAKKRKRKRERVGKQTQNEDNLQQQPISSLPQELIFTEILTRLPATSLLRLKSVCRQWNSMISTAQFAKLHLRRISSNPFTHTRCFIKSSDSFHLLDLGTDIPGLNALFDATNFGIDDVRSAFPIGSCNGLVCFCYPNLDCVYYDFIAVCCAMKHCTGLKLES
ncbi:hypothetical protein Ancab_009094 [Ancistrocladus abbreviatus]